MRDPLHSHLDVVGGQLVDMSTLVATAVRSASAVLLERTPERAQAVIDGDSRVNAMQYTVEDRVTEIMTRHQPIAGDLRFMLGAIRMTTDLERMGDMAVHIAKIAQRDGTACAVPAARPVYEAMAAVADRVAAKTTRILLSRDVLDAAQFDLDDDEMDAQFARLMALIGDDWPHGAEAAVDVAMLGRAYERFADHAVRIAHQIVYLVTGEVHLDRP
ncbi:phosphate transport system protein [Stackebrandtia albiflava]|uniref:Phosphate-specific transport system accessory protein PhoU n=1 Tax=Stackebrandtia albiflava TaxID=406432 RepID=A0A562VH12_9ACTN|nr:phosphate signaling complex protein PhoU [Stackebrandtia albiflava]TWJ17183.1 phosphate transport system protein [Stackebrandtia albiflava]